MSVDRGQSVAIAGVHVLHNKLHVSGAAGAGDEQACEYSCSCHNYGNLPTTIQCSTSPSCSVGLDLEGVNGIPLCSVSYITGVEMTVHWREHFTAVVRGSSWSHSVLYK